jgi:uncharacterized phiE125 gp8 family phage protein
MALTLLSPPLTQRQKLSIVTIEEVKRQGRILENDEDDLIADLIETAYDYLTGPTGWMRGVELIPQQYEYTVDTDESFEIPLRPLLASDVALEIWDLTTSAYVATENGLWYLDARGPLFKIARNGRYPWPRRDATIGKYARVVFTAGYGDAAEDIPAPIRQSIRMMAAHLFNNRETVGSEGRAPGQEILYGLRDLAGRYRVAQDPS